MYVIYTRVVVVFLFVCVCFFGFMTASTKHCSRSQHNKTQHNTTQFNTTQHNTTNAWVISLCSNCGMLNLVFFLFLVIVVVRKRRPVGYDIDLISLYIIISRFDWRQFEGSQLPTTSCLLRVEVSRKRDSDLGFGVLRVTGKGMFVLQLLTVTMMTTKTLSIDFYIILLLHMIKRYQRIQRIYQELRTYSYQVTYFFRKNISSPIL